MRVAILLCSWTFQSQWCSRLCWLHRYTTNVRYNICYYQIHKRSLSGFCVFIFLLQSIKQFLLLSKRRSALITQCLKDSETSKPNFMPRLYINRRLAMEHRDNPSLDPSCKNAVFTQVQGASRPTTPGIKPSSFCCWVKKKTKQESSVFITLFWGCCFNLSQVFEGLKPSDKFEKTLDYRCI